MYIRRVLSQEQNIIKYKVQSSYKYKSDLKFSLYTWLVTVVIRLQIQLIYFLQSLHTIVGRYDSEERSWH